MSKVSKLFKHPVRFFTDLGKGAFATSKGGTSFWFNRAEIVGGSDVVFYFAAGMPSYYQIEQWLPAFRKLAENHSVCFVVRQKSVFNTLRKNTEFKVVCCPTISSLMSFYDANKIKAIIYVNNAVKNFQSLINSNSFHIHINHGESEKSSMYSNQAKAYDFVFTVAQAGTQRYKNAWLFMDRPERFVEVGRPQLDNLEAITFERAVGKTVVLYAPTWKATHSSMDFSSVSDFGVSIASQVLENNSYYFLYKPHPATGETCSQEKKAHETIIGMIEKSGNGEYIQGAPINNVFASVDIAIFDNSSVVIDYLSADKPCILTDLFHRDVNLVEPPPIYKAARLLQLDQLAEFSGILQDELRSDSHRQKRREIKEFYLGNYGPGEATGRFVAEVGRIVNMWDKLNTTGDGTRDSSNNAAPADVCVKHNL